MYILVTPLPGLVDRGLSWPVVERACRARKPTITHARHVSLALPYLNCALMPRCSGGISVRFLDILLSVLSYVCTRQYNDIHFIPPHNGTMNAYEWFIPCVPQGSKSLWKSSCGVLPLRKSGEGEMYNRYRPRVGVYIRERTSTASLQKFLWDMDWYLLWRGLRQYTSQVYM